MLYFIPAWYQKDRWCENEQKWYVRRMHTEFDDTVKQVQLFHRSGICPCQMLLPGYAPNFRHFLHRQGVYRVPYWSCFDAVQMIRRRKAVPLSFHNMKWPSHTEFIYTMFAVMAMRGGEKYAQIEFGEDGNPIQIDLYENGKIRRQNLYDDRGFLSSTILCKENEEPWRQDYLMENGMWKLRHFLDDGHVEINPKCPKYLAADSREQHFSRLSYDQVEEMIQEVFTSFLEQTKEYDVFCLAMHDQHTVMMRDMLQGKKTVLSFFEDRYRYTERIECLGLVESAGYVVMDSRENLKRFKKTMGGLIKNSKSIPPFDTRMDPGISQQLEVQKILVPVDGMETDIFDRLMQALSVYLRANNKARVHLFTRQADYGRKQQLLAQAQRYLEVSSFAKEQIKKEPKDGMLGNGEDGAASEESRFVVEQCVDELSVSKCMREQRILVELRRQPELYLQIMALSTGIPQIVYTRTQFVQHEKNGRVLKDIGRLPETLAYYLESLKNWNDAMVASYQIGKRYTSEVLLGQWKEVIGSFGEDTDLTVRG